MDKQIVSGVFATHDSAELAVKAMIEAGVAANHVSIITKNLESTEQVQGFITTSDGATAGASSGAWWGGLLGLLFGVAVLWIPGVGPIVAAGTLTAALLGALEGAAIGTASGVLVGALVGYGFSQDKALKLQSLVIKGDFVVVVQGSRTEVRTAYDVLTVRDATEVETEDFQS